MQTLRLSIPDSQVKDQAATARMHQTILDKMATVPGVTSVGFASTVTMSGQGWHDPLYAQDRTYTESQIPADSPVQVRLARLPEDDGHARSSPAGISPGPMLRVCGRSAMVSENLARELWGEPSAAIGKRVRPYSNGVWREVVGVVGDMRDDGLNKKAPRPRPTGRS